MLHFSRFTFHPNRPDLLILKIGGSHFSLCTHATPVWTKSVLRTQKESTHYMLSLALMVCSGFFDLKSRPSLCIEPFNLILTPLAPRSPIHDVQDPPSTTIHSPHTTFILEPYSTSLFTLSLFRRRRCFEALCPRGRGAPNRWRRTLSWWNSCFNSFRISNTSSNRRNNSHSPRRVVITMRTLQLGWMDVVLVVWARLRTLAEQQYSQQKAIRRTHKRVIYREQRKNEGQMVALDDMTVVEMGFTFVINCVTREQKRVFSWIYFLFKSIYSTCSFYLVIFDLNREAIAHWKTELKWYYGRQ